MQLSVASCQLPVSKAPVAADGAFAAATAGGGNPAQSATFGSVLSARINTQEPANQDADSATDGSGAAAPEIATGKKAGTAKQDNRSRPEKRNGDELAPVQTPRVAEILPAYPIAAIAAGNSYLPQEGVKVSVACTAPEGVAEAPQRDNRGAGPANEGRAAEPANDESASGAASEGSILWQHTSDTVSSLKKQSSATQNTSTGDEPDATAVGPANASFPQGRDTSPTPAARRFEGSFAPPPEQVTGQPFTTAIATPENAKLLTPAAAVLPGGTIAEAPPPFSQGRTGNDESDATAHLTTPTPDELSDMPVRGAEAQLKPMPQVAPPVNSTAAHSSDLASKHIAQTPNRNARKPDANGTKPPQPSGDMTSDEGQARSPVSDSIADKPRLTQPSATASTYDGEGKTGTPANAVLTEAGRAAGNTADARDAKPQVASALPTSTPAENVPPAAAVIQSARVLERMGQSEMRLGLNSNTFGSIELHTSVNQDRVGACIATSHTDLRAAMMAEMPSLERAIAQHQLKLDNLNLDARTGTQQNGGGASGNQPGSSRSSTQSADKTSEFSDDTAVEQTAPLRAWAASDSGGLNVHA